MPVTTKCVTLPEWRSLIFLAPMAIQRDSSSLMLLRKIVGGEDLLRKTHAFILFHIDQEMSMVRDAQALRFWIFVPEGWFFDILLKMPWGSVEVLDMLSTHWPNSTDEEWIYTCRRGERRILVLSCKGSNEHNLANPVSPTYRWSKSFFESSTMWRTWL